MSEKTENQKTNDIFVPISINDDNYYIYKVIFSPKGPQNEKWIALQGDFRFTTKLNKIKDFYKKYLEDDYLKAEFQFEGIDNILSDKAHSTFLGMLIKINIDVFKQYISDIWASITITGDIEISESEIKLKEVEDVDKKYEGLFKHIKNTDKNLGKKHLFIYVAEREMENIHSAQIELKYFSKNNSIDDVFSLLFVKAISAFSGMYFENHTILDRFPEIYKGVFEQDSFDRYYNTGSFLDQRDFMNIIPQKIKDNDRNIERYEKDFFNEIDRYRNNRYSIKKFFRLAPFLFVEHYFYFDILKQLYNKGASIGKDPYKEKKRNSIEGKNETLKKKNKENMESSIKGDYEAVIQSIRNILKSGTTDLSQMQNKQTEHDLNNRVVIDDCGKFREYLNIKEINRMDIILDNFGFESLYTIILVINLIELKNVQEVYFHIKVLPIYVSDVIQSDYGDDVDDLLKALNNISELIFKKYKDVEERIHWEADMFWNMPIPFKSMPQNLLKKFSSSDLIIILSDLNYRKLIEDREWPCDTDIRKRINYFSAPILVIRALKSNILVGISKDQYMIHEKNAESCSEWRNTGEYGIIQFVNLRESHADNTR